MSVRCTDAPRPLFDRGEARGKLIEGQLAPDFTTSAAPLRILGAPEVEAHLGRERRVALGMNGITVFL